MNCFAEKATIPVLETPNIVYEGRDTLLTCRGNVGLSHKGEYGTISLEIKHNVSLHIFNTYFLIKEVSLYLGP